MTYYDPFDCKINCEELIEVTPEEQEEVFREMAQDRETQHGSQPWLDSPNENECHPDLEPQANEERSFTGGIAK